MGKDSPWKKFERKVGKLLGLPRGKERIGPTGLLGFDVIAPSQYVVHQTALGVECKFLHEGFPKWITSLLMQMRKAIKYHEPTMEPGTPAFYEGVAALGWSGVKDKEIVAVLPLHEYLELRKKASAWERQVDDIYTYAKGVTRECSSGVSIKSVCERFLELSERFKQRGF